MKKDKIIFLSVIVLLLTFTGCSNIKEAEPTSETETFDSFANKTTTELTTETTTELTTETTTELTTETTTELTTETTTETTTITTTTTTETTTELTTETTTKTVITAAQTSKEDSKTVYIGETGNKYHRSNCRTLKGGAYPISLDKALAQGRGACGVCHP